MIRDSGPRSVLITGGCGFIGTNLIGYLYDRGYKVRVLDSLVSSSNMWIDERSRSSGILMRGDIRDTRLVEQAVEGTDAVVHLAAFTSVVASLENPGESWDVNVNGSLNLLEACRRSGIDRFILASSNAVVGEQTPPINESKVAEPLSPYGASKLAGEALCSSYHHSFGLKTTSLRFANCYGPHCEHKPGVIPRFLGRAKEGKPLIIYGDGRQTRDFVHVSDVCQAIHLSLINPEPRGEVFQIASGTETSINELAGMVGEIAGVNLEVVHEPERRGEVRRNYSDISKARTMLSFEPKVALREGLRELWRNYTQYVPL